MEQQDPPGICLETTHASLDAYNNVLSTLKNQYTYRLKINIFTLHLSILLELCQIFTLLNPLLIDIPYAMKTSDPLSFSFCFSADFSLPILV